jgi:hypothetical protein
VSGSNRLACGKACGFLLVVERDLERRGLAPVATSFASPILSIAALSVIASVAWGTSMSMAKVPAKVIAFGSGTIPMA